MIGTGALLVAVAALVTLALVILAYRHRAPLRRLIRLVAGLGVLAERYERHHRRSAP